MRGWLECSGCAAQIDPTSPFPFRCPRSGIGDVDHVVRRLLGPRARFPLDDDQNPFIRYRTLLHAYHLARGGGLDDADFCALVHRLDRRVAGVDGHGFTITPFMRSDDLSSLLGLSATGGVWLKDETGNVAGSHKARHLFGVLLQLEVAEKLGLTDAEHRPDLAIASCGNAALAAAVLAAASGRVLRVFVPQEANPAVVAQLEDLSARVTVCPRVPGAAGDPSYAALLEAIAQGALPFTCQGNLNGLAVEGGMTLGYELASQLDAMDTTVDRVIVQVGGGALASAVFQALREAVALGVLERVPRFDTVQTTGSWPLKRAYALVHARMNGSPAKALEYAAQHRSEFMWAWEGEPQSIAGGILDDETYDWRAVVEGMLTTGGRPVVATEETLGRAHLLAHECTGIDVDPTGSSGLAGLLALRAEGEIADDERIAVLFTGVTRRPYVQSHGDRSRTHEELVSVRGSDRPVPVNMKGGVAR